MKRPLDDVAPDWAGCVERWYSTSTLSPAYRDRIRQEWGELAGGSPSSNPEITEPAQWTRQVCVEWIAAIDRMRAGDYVHRDVHVHVGKPLTAPTKRNLIGTTRTFFQSLQEWEWIPRRFDPRLALGVPRSFASLLGPKPRVIADDMWAKLLWAGMNLEPGDLTEHEADPHYPIELSRAVTITWLFGGLRSDEIARLRVGCIRWQHNDQPIAGDDPTVLTCDAVCLLDVPVNKTAPAPPSPHSFTTPRSR